MNLFLRSLSEFKFSYNISKVGMFQLKTAVKETHSITLLNTDLFPLNFGTAIARNT